MIRIDVEIGDLPALSYALAKGREGVEAAIAYASENNMSDKMTATLRRHLEAIERISDQLAEGKVE